MTLKGKLLLHGKTDVGSVRDHNEDTIGCDESIGLAVLADGMGGHRGAWRSTKQWRWQTKTYTTRLQQMPSTEEWAPLW